MFKKIGIILFLTVILWTGHALPIQGLAFAQLQDDGTPCPPECVTDSMEIVTWYPSPYNEYEELRLYPISESNSPNGECGQDNRGLMYYDKDDDKVYICKGAIEGWKELGGSGNLPQSTTFSSSCDSNSLGKLIYDTSRNRPYVCALNGSSYVWKPLDSDYDQDGVTDAVDYNDNDLNDATAVEANVETGKTFYARGGSRKTGTLVTSDVSGVCIDYYQGFWGAPLTCADGQWHAWADMHYCPVVLGNAFCDSGSTCGNGWWASNPCRCPLGYTLLQFNSYNPPGDNNGVMEYYCKKS